MESGGDGQLGSFLFRRGIQGQAVVEHPVDVTAIIRMVVADPVFAIFKDRFYQGCRVWISTVNRQFCPHSLWVVESSHARTDHAVAADRPPLTP